MLPAPLSPAEPAAGASGNMPALFFQCVLHADGRIDYPYLSGGCAALLGLPSETLQREPQRFADLIVPEDRKAYRASMQASASALASWNWEGRIWVQEYEDRKWINLRASPRALTSPALGVQWDGIMTNITASKLEKLEVTRSRERLAELTAHIEQVKEQERTRIAREIHDDLGGNLTAIKMALMMLTERLPDEPKLREQAEYVDALVDRTIDAVHRISLDLRPSMLDFGLVAALEWQSREFEKQNGISCAFSCSDRDIDVSLDRATAMFRIFQEALTNIAKHAMASLVTVRLERRFNSAAGEIVLSIADNGRGIAEADRSKPQSFGLRGMNERARALGGTMQLAVAPGGGTVVTIQIASGCERTPIMEHTDPASPQQAQASQAQQ